MPKLTVLRPGLYGRTFRKAGDAVEIKDDARAKHLCERGDCEPFTAKKKPAGKSAGTGQGEINTNDTDDDGGGGQAEGDGKPETENKQPGSRKKTGPKKPTPKKPAPKK